jgi:hypothetical protein
MTDNKGGHRHGIFIRGLRRSRSAFRGHTKRTLILAAILGLIVLGLSVAPY